MKRIVNLTSRPLNFEGQPIGDLSLGRLCAEVVLGLGNYNQDVVKLYGIAQELYLKGKIELNAEDVALLYRAVESCDRIVLAAKAQILMAIENSKPDDNG